VRFLIYNLYIVIIINFTYSMIRIYRLDNFNWIIIDFNGISHWLVDFSSLHSYTYIFRLVCLVCRSLFRNCFCLCSSSSLSSFFLLSKHCCILNTEFIQSFPHLLSKIIKRNIWFLNFFSFLFFLF